MTWPNALVVVAAFAFAAWLAWLWFREPQWPWPQWRESGGSRWQYTTTTSKIDPKAVEALDAAWDRVDEAFREVDKAFRSALRKK